MTGTRAAIRYAKAILGIAQENNNATSVNTDMLLIASSVKENKELKDFLTSPVIKGTAKLAATLEVFATSQNETKRLFQLLQENRRFEILEAIAIQYNGLFNELNNRETAVVTTAIPMTPELEKQVLVKVATFSSKTITLENIVDPAIIGGFILRIGDKQDNASVTNRLQQLKREFSN
jgi:F-type H+-transporting ATPase subunit delta